jgi:hypothetical protein
MFLALALAVHALVLAVHTLVLAVHALILVVHALVLAVHTLALELTLGANMHPHAFPCTSMLDAHALALAGCPRPHPRRTLCWATRALDTHVHVHVSPPAG